MNDENLEHHLRKLPAPELPPAWRPEILATARHASGQKARSSWPPLLVVLRNIFARNPFTATALTALWMLIFLFKAATPVDPAEREMLANIDLNRPVHLLSMRDKILLAELLQNQPESTYPHRIP